jgi:hypothetical protein
MTDSNSKADFFNDESQVTVFKTINAHEYTINKFKAHKEWSASSNNFNNSYNKINIYQGLKVSDNYKNGLIPYNTYKYTPNLNLYPPYTDKTIFWNSLEHNYYKEYNLGYSFNKNRKQILSLYESCSVASIPTATFGEGIKKNSIYIVDVSSWTPIEIIDDGEGNLIDKNIPTSSFISKQNLMLYLGFNDVYDSKHTYLYEGSGFNVNILNSGSIKIVPGIKSTGIYTGSSGKAIEFDSTNNLQIKNDFTWYDLDKGDNFSISFWIKVNSNQPHIDVGSDYKTIISKRKEGSVYNINKRTKYISKEEFDINSISYPVHIGVYSEGLKTGKVFFDRYDGENYTIVESNSSLYNNEYNHVVVNKTGSSIQMYINNVLENTITDTTVHTLRNLSDWFIGSDGVNKNNINCYFDEFRIYDKSLTQQEISNLYSNDFETGSAYQTNRIGNVFYRSGLVVVSDFRRRYHRVFLGTDADMDYSDTWNSIDVKWKLVDPTWNNLEIGEYYLKGGFLLEFKSIKTISEHEVVCKIKQSEFNMSLNPSLRVKGKIDSEFAKPFVTGSWFTPYITTIGLYNDKYELVAIAKLSSPIPKLSNVPLNFIVKFDT